MRKRIRKKLRIGEYRELGFEAAWEFDAALDEGNADAFWDSMIEFIEGRELSFGGGGDLRRGGGFITRPQSPGAAEADRSAVTAWLRTHPLVREYRVAELVDAWR